MGELLPFLHRIREDGQWTPAERARLEALADSVGGGGGGEGLELAFGTSDAGDPWCVVKDPDGEVLVHVARIGERFVAHFPLEDTLAEGADLYSTLREWLRTHEDGVVVAFNRAGREGQSLLAVLLAVAVLDKEIHGSAPAALVAPSPPPAQSEAPTHPVAQAALAAATEATPAAGALVSQPSVEPAPASSPSHVDPAPQGAGGRSAVAPVQDLVPTSNEPPSITASPPSAGPIRPDPQVAARDGPWADVHGTAGDDHLAGGPGAERLQGDAGNDTLTGGGGRDSLNGGQGDDRIELTGEVVAIGGSGADTFVIQAPAVMDRPQTLLGVVMDFRPADGDRLVTVNGRVVTSVSQTSETHLDPRTQAQPQTQTQTVTDQRVEVDIDGDGAPDGFVLLSANPIRAAGEPSHDWIGL
ncbi:hypothetical protein LJR225_000446 [Phenylobacterium sp. LjRoot225]|uniref:hypothetical protein n=1 Tax=Phenylobacterium sp. LjRoot225 TaxID=3342285 RepID=UPI003ECEC7D2